MSFINSMLESQELAKKLKLVCQNKSLQVCETDF